MSLCVNLAVNLANRKEQEVQFLLCHPHMVWKPALGFCKGAPSMYLPAQARSTGLNGLRAGMTHSLCPLPLTHHKPKCLSCLQRTRTASRLKCVAQKRQKGTHSKRGEEGKNPPLPSQSHPQGQQFSLYKTLALFLI